MDNIEIAEKIYKELLEIKLMVMEDHLEEVKLLEELLNKSK